MQKWRSNLCIALIGFIGLQLSSADIDRLFYSKPVQAPEKMGFQQNQVQVVTKNDTIKSESEKTPDRSLNASDEAQKNPSQNGALTLETLNAMDAKALEQINGVGPVLAKRIVAYRQEHGAFKSLDGLDAVKGVGPKILEKIKSQFEGSGRQ